MTLAGLMSLAACNAVVPAQLPVLPPADSPSRVAAAVPASDALALELFRDVVASEKGNVVFSPASAENLLRLLQRGATGKTRAAFDALPMGKTGVCSAMQVKSADGLFAENRVQVHLADVPLQRVPFATDAEAAARAVNDWCKEKTEGCIPELLRGDDISADTALIALNAVYLREKWLRPFAPDATDKNADFLAPGGKKKVEMMFCSDRFRYAEGLDWKAVALFYDTGDRPGEPGCFIGILPKGDARSFAATLTPQKYSEIRGALASSRPQELEVSLPKFTVRTGTFDLTGALKKAGLGIAFSPTADFSALATDPAGQLRLSAVVQRCYVDISETETVAAAVTGGFVVGCAILPMAPPPAIRFDRPFIWAIGDLTTGAAPYFMGLFEQPN